MTQPVYVFGGKRIPFTKSLGHYLHLSPQELMTFVLEEVVKQHDLSGEILGDVVLGAIMKHPRDFNLARECVLGTTLDPHTPGMDIQRACGTGLSAAVIIANAISLGQIDCGIAGGVDTNSDLPITISKKLAGSLLEWQRAKSWMDGMKNFLSLRPADLVPETPRVVEPRTGMSMGEHCEKMAQEWHITQAEQDQLAFESHQKAAKAYADGFQSDIVVPFSGLKQDTILRPDTTIEKLTKLKPAFERSAKGTLTAGNSTALTDGAAAVLLGNQSFAERKNLKPLARFVDAQVAALDFVKGEGLLMAPTYAVAELLKRNKLSFADFDYFELHEAFAAQVLCTLKAWESKEYCETKLGLSAPLGAIPREKLNVHGSSLAYGHPFAATGARIVATLAKELHQKGSGRGLISICTAGGMGVAAILEK